MSSLPKCLLFGWIDPDKCKGEDFYFVKRSFYLRYVSMTTVFLYIRTILPTLKKIWNQSLSHFISGKFLSYSEGSRKGSTHIFKSVGSLAIGLQIASPVLSVDSLHDGGLGRDQAGGDADSSPHQVTPPSPCSFLLSHSPLLPFWLGMLLTCWHLCHSWVPNMLLDPATWMSWLKL